jgi:hypothetical protein
VPGLQLRDAGASRAELVLQRHDPGGRVEVQALVEQGAHPRGQHQLPPGVAPVTATGAHGGEDAGSVQAAQERRLHIQQLGGLAHRHRGVVLVVQPVDTHRMKVLPAHDRARA